MKVANILAQVRSWAENEAYERVADSLRPLYRRVVYDVYQPIQNRVQFWNRLRETPSFDIDDQDVLIVVVDCLRNDHLSRTGYDRETTPFLDSLETYYPHCVSAAAWTYSSVPSLLTGLYPHNHGAAYDRVLRNQTVGNPPATIREEVFTLPEYLAKADYDTYFSSAVVTAELPLRGRFGRAEIRHDVPANEVVDDALAWWDSSQGDRFGYLHLGDLHAPLHHPSERPFGEIERLPGIERWRFTETTEPADAFEAYRRERIRFYDTVLRFVDEQLERLFDALAERGDLEDTLIVVTGDHGEEFWERVNLERRHFHDPRGIYGTGHGHALVPEVTDVPLFVVGGHSEATTAPVSTVDIVPTLLTELGLPDDQLPPMDGVPLDSVPSDRSIFAEEVAYGYDQRAVIYRGVRLIDSPHENESVLLDEETGAQVEDAALESELREEFSEEKHLGRSSKIDAKTKEHLADLGYL